MRKLRLTVIVLAIAMLATTAGAFACTGMYVGKDASTDGTTVIARSEDQGGGAYNKMYKVEPAKTEKGRYFVDTGEGQDNFKVPLPEKTYRYTYVPDGSDLGDGMYPACCTNEYGVGVVGTISAEPSEEFAKVDPFVERGLREAILPGLIACQVKTAKEAVDLTAKLVDEYGSQEGNILFYADPKEAWIIEIYGGHSYCAMRLPEDKVSVFGNQFMIGRVDPKNTKDYVFSKDLFKNVEKAGAVKEDGEINLAKSISKTREEYSNMRTWEGERVLAPSIAGSYENDKFYPLLFKPDKKVSMQEVFDMYRDRYQGTPYDMTKSENAGRRPIGVTRSSDVHAIQIYSDLPKDSCCVQWLCMGNAEHSVFVPSFSGITDTIAAYQMDNCGTKYDPNSAWWQYKRNDTLANTDKTHLTPGVQQFWREQEKEEVDNVHKTVKEVKKAYEHGNKKGEAYVTKWSNDMAEQQLANANTLYGAMMFTATNNINDREDTTTREYFVPPTNLQTAAENMGYRFKVDKPKKDGTIKFYLRKGNDIYYFKVGDVNYKMVNGSKKTKGEMSSAPFEENGKIYVPIDFLETLKK